MCICSPKLRAALHAVSIKDGDIILVDARVIYPEAIASVQVAGITKPVFVLCIHPPEDFALDLKQALCTVDLAMLKQVVQDMEDKALKDAPAFRG